MSWFYPLQKLFGYEVGPEDATKATQENIQAGRHTDRDIDILISRQEDPNIREYQEKAIAEKRFQDSMFKIGLGPRGQSAYSISDPYMPTISSIQKREGIEPNKIQAAVIAEIDAWNQENRVRNRRNEFRGAMPSPKRILGDKYIEDKEYHWRNTGKNIATILDLSEGQYTKGVSKSGAYGTAQDRIEWKEPVTRRDRTNIAHEQIHRFIEKHPAGKGLRHENGNNELFVRAYTHLLDGGSLDDLELMEDLRDTSRHYSNINLNSFWRNLPQKIERFEQAIIDSKGQQPMLAANKSWQKEQWKKALDELPKDSKNINEQMQQLLSPIKQNEYFPTFIENLKLRESDHGSTPIPTNDDKEKHLPKNQRTLDIAYGHKIRPYELAVGEIHGIKFRDSNGNYIPLTDKNKIFILEQDIYRETDEALEASWNEKLADRGLVWEDLPNKYKYPLMDLAFNTGAETAKQWTDIFDDVKSNNDKNFVKNLRREGGTGTWTKGMDNRVAIVAYNNGLVDSLKQAKEYGLKLADTTEIPRGGKQFGSFLQTILNNP